MNQSTPAAMRRDRLGAVGVMALMLFFALNLVALGVDSIFGPRTVSQWLVPSVPLGLIVAGVLVRDAWRLARGQPSSPSLRRMHRRILALAAGLVAAALWASLQTGAFEADSSRTLSLLTTALALLGAVVILLVAGIASVRPAATRFFKLKEGAVILAAGIVVFGALPAFMWRDVSAMKRALRVETSSRDPFVIALCHGDHDKAAALLPSVGEQGAREAASCIPDDYARYMREQGLGQSQAGMRRTLAIEAVMRNDPLITDRGRGDGPCTVAEANLLQRLQRVAPKEVRLLSFDRLPTTCLEAGPAVAPGQGHAATVGAPTAASDP
jgi:hypothetical protein